MFKIRSILDHEVTKFNNFVNSGHSKLLQRAAFYAYCEIRYNHLHASGESHMKACECLTMFMQYTIAVEFIFKHDSLIGDIHANKHEKFGIDIYNIASELVDKFDTINDAIETAKAYLKKYNGEKNPEKTIDMCFEKLKDTVDYVFPDLFDETGAPIVKTAKWGESSNSNCSNYTSSDFEEDFNDLDNMFEDEDDSIESQKIQELQASEEYIKQSDISQDIFIEYFNIKELYIFKVLDEAYDIMQSVDGSDCNLIQQSQVKSFIKSFEHLKQIYQDLRIYESDINNDDFSSMEALLEATRLSELFVSTYESIMFNHANIISFVPSQLETYQLKAQTRQ